MSHWSQRRAASQSPLRLGLLPLPREEFRQLKLILHSELRRRAESRRALPCPSSFFLFLFRHAFSEVPRPIALKFGHVVGNCLNFIIQVQKFGGPSPKKNLGGKNMQNFGRFYTTSDFDREYLRNGSRYLKSERKFFQIDSFCVLRKRSRELWSTSC